MTQTVCITGGSGMIGSAVGRLLNREGHRVYILSRSDRKSDFAETFTWDLSKGTIDQRTLESSDTIIHLAGTSIADKRWSKKQKEKIRKSRTGPTRFLYEKLAAMDKKPSTFITASATGVYGHDTGGLLVDENRVKPGDDFLATVTREWEAEAGKISTLGIRLIIFRIGIVLSDTGGALTRMKTPVKLGLGAPLGSGNQYLSWIHINDLCRAFQFAIENREINGIYNVVAPQPVTNREFNQIMAKTLNKPFILPAVPGYMLRLALGEMASILTGGNRVSSGKLQEAGFRFDFPVLEEAFQDLLK